MLLIGVEEKFAPRFQSDAIEATLASRDSRWFAAIAVILG
jgi:hypothetical protein